MGLHGCNENCDLHPDMHSAQRDLLDMEGGHGNPQEERMELLKALRVRSQTDKELIEILEKYEDTRTMKKEYELAKELKDAGFPQEFKLGSWVCEHGDDSYEKKCQCYGDLLFYSPTLSELIEACGITIKLWCLKDGRGGVQLEGQSLEDVVYYSTPEEAVARLWLALNTPQTL